MSDDADLLPDPQEAEVFASYNTTCVRPGVMPVSAERAADLIREWTDALNRNGDQPEKPD